MGSGRTTTVGTDQAYPLDPRATEERAMPRALHGKGAVA